MKKSSLGILAYGAFQSIQGWLIGIVSLLLAIIFAPATDTISLRWFYLVVAVAFLFIVTLLQLVWKLYTSEIALLPSLITVETMPVPDDPNAVVLLLEPSELFSHDSSVAIYHYHSSFERLVGIGYVLTIQRDQRIQVIVKTFVEPQDSEPWGSLVKKNADVMKQVIVKPHLPKAYAGQV